MYPSMMIIEERYMNCVDVLFHKFTRPIPTTIEGMAKQNSMRDSMIFPCFLPVTATAKRNPNNIMKHAAIREKANPRIMLIPERSIDNSSVCNEPVLTAR